MTEIFERCILAFRFRPKLSTGDGEESEEEEEEEERKRKKTKKKTQRVAAPAGAGTPEYATARRAISRRNARALSPFKEQIERARS